MQSTDKAVTDSRTVASIDMTGSATRLVQIEEEKLSDGSVVFNAHIPAQTVYCRNQVAAIMLAAAINKAIEEYQS